MTSHFLYSVIFLPLILVIGLITSCDDLFTSKIRNKWVLLGLSYAFMVYIFSWVFYFLASGAASSKIIKDSVFYMTWHFDKWCINLIVSTIVAYALWRYKMWGAGDAKLFIAYAALIPMGQYSRVYFKYYFASFLLLLMIFIPATIYLFLKSCFFFLRRFNFEALARKARESKARWLSSSYAINAGKVFFGFFVYFLFFRIFRSEFTNLAGKFILDQKILVAASILIFKPLARIFRKKSGYVILVFLSLLLYLIFTKGKLFAEITSTISGTLAVMLLFFVFEKITNLYIERTTQKTSPFALWIFLGVLLTWFFKFSN